MLKKQNIICISSIDWDFIWQGHQEIMTSLAKNGNRVLFIENTGVRPPAIKDIPRIKQRIKNWLKGINGIRQESENLYIYSPLVLPFPYSRIARWINCCLILPFLDKWIKVANFGNPVLWTFLPTPLSLDIIDNISKKVLIYYCIDSFTVSSASAKKIRKSEEKLLRKADLVFVTSTHLFNYCSKYNDSVYKFPFAVNFEKFEKVRLEKVQLLDELKSIKKPIIGYVGGIHKWIDQKLVKELAERLSEYSFVFVGPIQTRISSLMALKNIYFFGKQEHSKLPLFINNFDLCIIPYSLGDYTRNVYPTKLNEYHAMGKPVVSTNLPEIEEFNAEFENLVFIGRSSDEFADCILKAINSVDETFVNKRIASARRNSWSARIDKMSELLRQVLREKAKSPVNWQENLLRFYRVTRRRTIKVVGLALVIYMLIFYTPFVWLIASPLKISDALKKVDAIVVFGGGVGETGSPGKSTIERSRYAAKLYNEKLAPKIIFSSGYTYIKVNDAENMKLIALSMHVPEKDIILEEKANSAYENVKYCNDIIRKNNWKSIILVSTPYNMLRVKLIFNKINDDIDVTYAPVPFNQFYYQYRKVRLEQIRGIMHEYLGILYYFYKDYI